RTIVPASLRNWLRMSPLTRVVGGLSLLSGNLEAGWQPRASLSMTNPSASRQFDLKHPTFASSPVSAARGGEKEPPHAARYLASFPRGRLVRWCPGLRQWFRQPGWDRRLIGSGWEHRCGGEQPIGRV